MSYEDVSYCPTRTTAWSGEVAVSSYAEPQYADYSKVEYFQPSDAEEDQRPVDQNGHGQDGGIPGEGEWGLPMTAAQKKAAKKAAKKAEKAAAAAAAEEVPAQPKEEEPEAVPEDEQTTTGKKKKKSKGKKNTVEEMPTPPVDDVEALDTSKSKKEVKDQERCC